MLIELYRTNKYFSRLFCFYFLLFLPIFRSLNVILFHVQISKPGKIFFYKSIIYFGASCVSGMYYYSDDRQLKINFNAPVASQCHLPTHNPLRCINKSTLVHFSPSLAVHSSTQHLNKYAVYKISN